MSATVATPKPPLCDCLMPRRGDDGKTCQRCRRPLRGATEGLHRPAPIQIKR